MMESGSSENVNYQDDNENGNRTQNEMDAGIVVTDF